jgi:hypothetical protein
MHEACMKTRQNLHGFFLQFQNTKLIPLTFPLSG